VTGIDVRHRKGCERPRDDGKCCGAGYQAHVFDAAPASGSARRSPPAPRRKAVAAGRDRRAAQGRVGQRHADRPHRRAGARRPARRDARRDGPRPLRASLPARHDPLLPGGRRPLPACPRSAATGSPSFAAPTCNGSIDRMHADGLAGSTIRNKLDPLRVAYRRAIQDDEITRTPLDNLRLPALKTKPRAGGRARARRRAARGPAGRRAGAVDDVVLRRAEDRRGPRAALGVQVDFDAGVIRVQAGWDDAEGEQDTKTDGRRPRRADDRPKVRAELARQRLATGRGGDDLVFGRTAADAFTRSTVRARAIKAWAESGAVTPHEARHCAASYFAQAGLVAQGGAGGARPRRSADDDGDLPARAAGMAGAGRREARRVPRCDCRRLSGIRRAWYSGRMSDDKMIRPGDDGVEQRGLVSDLLTPAAVVAAPIVSAWAQQHFGKSEQPPSPPAEPSGNPPQE
jgi:hypothetical protein